MGDILIIGAGPTGLVLALALLQRGIPVRIIDQKDGPSMHSKALGIHARTMEILEKLGVVRSFLEKGLKAHSIIFHKNQKEIPFELDEKYLEDTRYPFVLILPQSDTEQLLLDAITKLGGKIEWNKQLISIESKEAKLASGEKIPFEWLIGCDGGKSTVRSQLNLPFGGVELPETFLIVDVKGKSNAKSSSPHFFFSKNGLVGFIAFQNSLIRLIFPLKKNEKIENNPEEIINELHKRGCSLVDRVEIEWFSCFKIHRRMVDKLRAGNCFLAGDAAHIHSPAGGQGMNTSIQDAYNLAWKLALVTQGIASPSLLDSYEKERIPVAKKVLYGTTLFTKLLNFVQNTGIFPLFFFVLFVMRTFFKKKMVRGLTELSVAYKKNPFIQEPARNVFWPGPKPGMRAPNVFLESGKYLSDYLDPLLPTILLFQQNAHIPSQTCNILILSDAKLMHTYKAAQNSVYFIRPDGVIGYRSRSYHSEEFQKYVQSYFKL